MALLKSHPESNPVLSDIPQIVNWFNRPRRALVTPEEANRLYFHLHPRTSFLKMLPQDARVADIGAGDGSLSVFRQWPAPLRPDLELHAYSIEKGRLFDEFKSYELSDWNHAPPEFGGLRFDGVVCGHFIEHVERPESLAAWLQRKLAPGGRAYVEWPSVHSLGLPSRADLERHGVDLMISRFDDDHTHRALPDREAVLASMGSAGLETESQGIIRMPWIEDQLMANFRDSGETFPRQAAFWLATAWSQFIVVSKPA